MRSEGTAMSLTLLCMSQQCDGTSLQVTSVSLRCQSGVNDTAVHVPAVPMTLLCFCMYSRVRFLDKNCLSDQPRKYLTKLEVHCTAVVLTPL
jgi:hypothetical protein